MLQNMQVLGEGMRKIGVVTTAARCLRGARLSRRISFRPMSPPVMYQGYTCQQLAQEAQGVSTRAAQVSGAQDRKRSDDQIATGVAVVIFWPAAVLVGGDGATAAELAQLKGQMTAIE